MEIYLNNSKNISPSSHRKPRKCRGQSQRYTAMPDGVSIILQVAPFSHDRSSHVRGAAVDVVVGRLVEGVQGALSHSSRFT